MVIINAPFNESVQLLMEEKQTVEKNNISHNYIAKWLIFKK